MLRKNSDIYDIFSRTGQIGSFIKKRDPFINGSPFETYVTQKFFDTDNGWEVLYKNNYRGFLLVDDNGSTILSDVCQDPYNDTLRYSSNIGFDGNSIYLCVEKYKGTPIYPIPSPYKLYRFRTNISPTRPQTLSKKAAGPNTMMFFGPSAGDYRISLLPSGGGKTSVQLFDMVGRQVFESQVDDITRPFSITIPAEQTSRTPFITRVRDKNGSVVKKEIPVR